MGSILSKINERYEDLLEEYSPLIAKAIADGDTIEAKRLESIIVSNDPKYMSPGCRLSESQAMLFSR
jgi:predicted thioredoxin/glutaredoxin